MIKILILSPKFSQNGEFPAINLVFLEEYFPARRVKFGGMLPAVPLATTPLCSTISSCVIHKVAAWSVVVNTLCPITLRRARLIPGWVTILGQVNHLGIQLRQLSLLFLRVGTSNTGLPGWGWLQLQISDYQCVEWQAILMGVDHRVDRGTSPPTF